MDYKECQTSQYERKNRFQNKIKLEAIRFIYHLGGEDTLRYAIQQTKEAQNRGISGEFLGKVFKGNSNKYYNNGGDCKIINKVQKRNNEKKSKLFEQIY